MMNQRVADITKSLENHFGEPKWAGGGRPLNSLINTVLSQNTNDKNRDAAYEALRKKYPAWEDVMNSSPAEIAAAIRPAGLSNQKSVRIKHILEWIYETYGSLDIDFICSRNPQEVIDEFMQLKGIGIKTISVVLMFTCGVDIFPVDTHVHRICRRIGLVPDNASAEKTHHLMQSLVPGNKSYSLHMNFLKLGRTICKAAKPRCDECPIVRLCNYGVQLNQSSNQNR
ncbi:endonuclease III [candidate division KSB1 bacterium]|nr:endonuclease III [candidate division KSB1 bacterium]